MVLSPSAAEGATCGQLMGKTVLRNGIAKVVRTPLRHGRARYFGCVLPRGTAHPIGGPVGPDVGGFETTQSIGKHAGRFLTATYTQSAGTTVSYDSRVYDLATGRSYLFAHGYSSENESDYYALGTAVRTFLDARGRLVASYVRYEDNPDPNGDQIERTTIALFSATGRRRTLDEGLASSVRAATLRLTGGVASWTSRGQRKTYRLS